MNRALWTQYAQDLTAPKPKRVRRNAEHEEQKAVVSWCELNKGRYPALALIFAIPNQSQGSVMRGKYYKAEGQRAGAPDLCLPVARQGFHGLYIEMKAERRHPTPAQQEFLLALQQEGYAATVCFGAADAIEFIKRYISHRP